MWMQAPAQAARFLGSMQAASMSTCGVCGDGVQSVLHLSGAL
jgi:hypothetical protein